jgi:large subunit ribosomal protein L5
MAKEETKKKETQPAEAKAKEAKASAKADAKPKKETKPAAKGTAKAEPKAKGGAKAQAEAPAEPKVRKKLEPRTLPRLLDRYKKEIVGTLRKEFGYKNVMQVPKVEKIVVNIGLGEALTNAKAMDAAVGDVVTITGQKPIVQKAKKSIATFKLREGQSVGIKVTLRGDRMFYFLDRLVTVALPRLRDFRGVSREAFDGRGNYTLGLREQLVFPEIDYDKIDKVRGMEVTIVTTARTDDEARRLLQLLGMPFRTA